MMKSVIPASALLLCSAFAFAAGGGAGGGGGAAGAAGGVRVRSGCLGAVAGVPNAGGPWPEAPPSNTNPSPRNGSAVEGIVQSNSDLPRLSPQDQQIIAAIKLGNEKLEAIGNPTNGRSKNRPPSRPANVIGTNNGIQKRNGGPFPPLAPPELGDSSAAKETTDPRSFEGKPDVNHMSEESQRLAREIIRATDKLGKVGNAGRGDGTPFGSSDLRSDTTGPHRPTSTIGARPRPC
jgi:hypothetical protein